MFSAALKSGSASAPKDPQFNYVAMLLHGDGTNGAQNNTFLDSSTNNFTITRNGNTTQGSFSPYGPNWSNFFSGTSGQYLNTVANAVFSFGTGDFTVEGWVFPTGTNTGAPMPIVEIRTNSTNTTGFAFMREANALTLNVYQNGYKGASTGSLTFNAWNHVALVRSGNTWTYWINGVSSGSFTNSTNLTDGATTGPKIGGSTTSGEVWIGYLSNVRITKGGALYTSTFTPSTTPLTTTVSAGTVSLLTCADNRFIDESTNNFTITRNGAVNVQRFNPFGAYTPYSTSVIGGSGYFDGTGDSLTAPTNFVLNGSFCIEGWFKTTTTTTYACIFSDETGTNGTTILLNNGSNNGQITVYSTNIVSNFASTVTGLNNNAWHHVAFTRNGTTCYLFIDGVQETTTTGSGTSTGSTARIGASFFASREFNGFISDFRIVTGSAVYTAAFTPPTAPLTAISGTQLLLSTTNGAIFDNAMMNNLETVGNAQISTSVKKFGTGSLAFDGTGDYLTTPFSAMYQFGTGDFTIEFWIYRSAGSVYQAILDTRSSGIATPWAVLLNSSNQPYILIASDLTSSIAVPATTWTHIAICRASGTLRIFNDGVQGYSAANTTSMSPTGALRIGKTVDNLYDLNGYIDDLRITKGYARYTAAFTAPTAAFPNIGPT